MSFAAAMQIVLPIAARTMAPIANDVKAGFQSQTQDIARNVGERAGGKLNQLVGRMFDFCGLKSPSSQQCSFQGSCSSRSCQF